MVLSKETIERFMKVDPAAIGHYISSGFMSPKIKPAYKSAKIVGPAYTVRMPDRDASAIYYAMQKAPKGSVIVVDRVHDDLFACTGEMSATMAKCLGLAGIVVDGPATDSLALEKMGFPVFCTGFSPVTSIMLGTSGEVDIPIQCGGAVVNPGDLIFGDADGVIVVSQDYDYEEALAKAEIMVENEAKRRKKMAEGYMYTKREDFDVEKFFNTDMMAVIADIKKQCK